MLCAAGVSSVAEGQSEAQHITEREAGGAAGAQGGGRRIGAHLSSFPNATLVAPQAQEVYFNKLSDRGVNYSEFFPLEGPIDRATSSSHAHRL